MRIGIDARPLQAETQYRGIGRSLHFVLNTLYKIDKTNSYVFYLESGAKIPTVIKNYTNSKIIFIKKKKVNSVKYLKVIFQNKEKLKPNPKDVDVILQYDAGLGIPTNLPTVVVFYDIIPLIFKETTSDFNSDLSLMFKLKSNIGKKLVWKNYLKTLAAYKKATKVIAISKSSADDYLKYKVDTRKKSIEVVYLGAEPKPSKSIVAPKNMTQLAKKRFLLYVGGIDSRKNIMGLLNNFYKIKVNNPDLCLVIAGKEFTLTKELENLGWFKKIDSNIEFKKDIYTYGFVSDDELHYLYSNALAFVFPSRYEGFGLPILEAMQAGCPVICYDNSSLPEVAGSAALMVADGESMVPAIEKLITNPNLREELKAAGFKQAKKFTWEKTAKETLRLLEEVAKKK